MKITSSYCVHIKNLNKILRPTINIYNNAVSFCVKNLNNDWNEIKQLDGKNQNNYCENLLHTGGKSSRMSEKNTMYFKYIITS